MKDGNSEIIVFLTQIAFVMILPWVVGKLKKYIKDLPLRVFILTTIIFGLGLAHDFGFIKGIIGGAFLGITFCLFSFINLKLESKEKIPLPFLIILILVMGLPGGIVLFTQGTSELEIPVATVVSLIGCMALGSFFYGSLLSNQRLKGDTQLSWGKILLILVFPSGVLVFTYFAAFFDLYWGLAVGIYAIIVLLFLIFLSVGICKIVDTFKKSTK